MYTVPQVPPLIWCMEVWAICLPEFLALNVTFMWILGSEDSKELILLELNRKQRETGQVSQMEAERLKQEKV